MSQPNPHALRDEVLRHFLQGNRLSREAREHYLQCRECIAEVTRRLSREAVQSHILLRGGAARDEELPEAALRAWVKSRELLESLGIRRGAAPEGPA